MKKLLMVLTNTSTLTLTDGSEYPSGYWGEEFAIPYELYRKAGYTIDIATIDGRPPTVDASSLTPETIRTVRPAGIDKDDAALAQQFKATIDGCADLKTPLDLGRLSRDDLSGYAGMYIAGGHGCMEDMPASPTIRWFLLTALALDLPIATVCHGPSAFLTPREATGQSPFEGYRMTCFSHAEEFLTRINGKLPFVLEIELKRLGVHYSKAPVPWGSYVVVDRNLITGQNPYSSEAVAQTFIRHLEERTLGR